MKAIPPVIPAPKLSPTAPNIIAVPPVIYSQPCAPQPSTTAKLPEFLTANLSPACPEANSLPEVAPYKTVFPIIVFWSAINLLLTAVLTIIFPPDKPFPT